jgi:hypothetical protein
MSGPRSPDETNAQDMEFRLGSRAKTVEVQALIDELIGAVVPLDERPIVITDSATIFDVTTLDEAEVAQRCEARYGRRPTSTELGYPIWRLAQVLGRADTTDHQPPEK